ncbi:lipoate--protein ligase family protein [Actinospongicola halichondriae]|uniref:lipoate--protein ligase family protein n=1 Tax=Actinospongicola halichondriae TaxID=3236844 RepID=UPI003D485223
MIVEHHRGTAAALHAMEVPADGRRRLWILEATRPAVVLGSTQSLDVVDREVADAAGVDVVRRRSGGGAVWVAPGEPLWVDVVIPRLDPLWTDDVGHAFAPIGRAWSSALASIGIGDTAVHEGPLVRTEWSDLVCFSGTGPGEVLRAGRKLVGISQRRTRGHARFQCAIPRHWDPEPLRSVLRTPPPEVALATVGTGVGDVDAETLVAAFVDALG